MTKYTYEHDFEIKHLPKVLFGMFLIVFAGIAMLSGFYQLFVPGADIFTMPKQIVLLFAMLNTFGFLSGIMFVIDNVEYTSTRVIKD